MLAAHSMRGSHVILPSAQCSCDALTDWCVISSCSTCSAPTWYDLFHKRSEKDDDGTDDVYIGRSETQMWMVL